MGNLKSKTLLISIIFLLNIPVFSNTLPDNLSETAKNICSNNHNETKKYECVFKSNTLIEIIRYDLDSNQTYYKSKHTYVYSNEVLKKVIEYSTLGHKLRVVEFDSNQNTSLEVYFLNKETERFESQFQFKLLNGNNKANNLVSRSYYKDNNYESGFQLQGNNNLSTGEYIVDSFTQYGSNKEVLYKKNNLENLNCSTISNSSKTEVMIIEPVGIDVNHPELSGKFSTNPSDPVDGVDNDGNGLIDDCVGYSITGRSHNKSVIDPDFDSFIKPNTKYLNATHGTMVTDIATRNNNEVSIYPVGGRLKNPLVFENASKIISNKKIKFVNMSFMFGVSWANSVSSYDGFRLGYAALKKLMLGQKKTLFVVASGNGWYATKSLAINVDSIRQYPVSFLYNNILSVGAINSSDIQTSKLHEYKMEDYSNYGLKSVDILAPGIGKDMTTPGGLSTETANGTSFAAPYITNLVTKIYNENKNLSNTEIKELILKTAYIPDLDTALKIPLDHPVVKHRKRRVRVLFLKSNPTLIPVRSGGIVHPERALLAAQILSENDDLNPQLAALKARKNNSLLATGELNSEEYLNKLVEFWELREL